MAQGTLRSYLQEHCESSFIFCGGVVSAHDLVNYYSAYLDAQVGVEDPWIFFVSRRGQAPRPFACRVPLQLQPKSDLRPVTELTPAA